MLAGCDIVCIGTDPWHSLPRRRHRIMAQFARRNRVLWIEPPVSWLTPLRDRSQLPALLGWRPGVRHVQDGLYIISLLDTLPLSRLGWARAVNAWRQRRAVRGAARRLGMARPILWVNFNWALVDYIGQLGLGERLVVYDCWDKHTGFLRDDAGRSQGAAAIEAWERRVARRADVVFTASEMLSEHVRALGARVAPIMVPNAADLATEAVFPPEEPPDMAAIRRPRIGQIGSIGSKVDLALLAAIAEQRPDWSIVLVGPVEIDRDAIARLRALPNVHLLGARPAVQLPTYAAALDVGLIPFRLDAEEVQYTSFPNRFWEYLAAGRPIVSVPLAELSAFDGFVRQAEGSDGFVVAIEAALVDADAAAVAARRRLAAANTWQARAEQMAEAVQRALVEDPTRREAVG